MRWLAFTRAVSSRLAECELTHLRREPIDVERARREHEDYERTLEDLGCRLDRLPELEEAPDGVFVEDTAVVLPELAVITRPGAASRRREIESTARALAELRPLHRIEAPATLDGGDVLVLGRQVFVGRSSRTDEAGAKALRELLAPHGYRVQEVPLRRCLHLKTGVTALDEGTVLLDPRCVDPLDFPATEILETHPDEIRAANALRIGTTIVFPAHFPKTAERLEARGYPLRRVEMRELARAEAGVTCCSLLLDLGDGAA